MKMMLSIEKSSLKKLGKFYNTKTDFRFKVNINNSEAQGRRYTYSKIDKRCSCVINSNKYFVLKNRQIHAWLKARVNVCFFPGNSFSCVLIRNVSS